MRKNLFLYIIAFITVVSMAFLLNREYTGLTVYTELSNRHNQVYSIYQHLRVQINNAAVLNPELIKTGSTKKNITLFFTDSLTIINQLNLLQSIVRDSVNIKIAGVLNKAIRAELSWLLNSNVPDSIIAHKSAGHVAAFESIDSLINHGIVRIQFLIEERKKQLSDETVKLKLWITLFIILTASLLISVTISLLQQQSKRKSKEQELETVFNRINDSVVSIDNNWCYTFLNDTALSTHPLGKEETLGKSIWDVHPEIKGTIFWDKYHEAMQTKKVVEIEDYYAPMDLWFSVKVYPSADGLTIFYKDITKNKRTEAEISQLNAELEKKVLERTDELLQAKNNLAQTLEQANFSATIANNIQDPVISTTNTDGKNFIITRWNKAAEKLFEWKSDEVIGKNATEIFKTGYPYETREQIFESWKTNGFWQGELTYQTKSGKTVPVLSTISFLKDAAGNITGNLVLIRDITERKKAEDALKKLNEELEAFSYSISHDLRAPLRGIIGFTNILEEDYSSKLDDEAKRITSIIKKNTNKMGNLIDDLLSFSRLGRQPVTKINVNFNKIINEVIAELGIKNNHQQISWITPVLPPVKADPNTIKQVWMNLIANAVKYSNKQEHPLIETGSLTGTNETIFFVKDNGVGFDVKYKDKLFKVFQRLHSAAEFEGTGVGLAIIEKIITKHGGRVWAEAEPGKGACFYFSLPDEKTN